MCHVPWCKSFHYGPWWADHVASLDAAGEGWAQSALLSRWGLSAPAPRIHLNVVQSPCHGGPVDLLVACSYLPSPAAQYYLRMQSNWHAYSSQASSSENSKLRFCVFQRASLQLGEYFFFLLVEGKIVSLQGDVELTYFCYLLLCVPQLILSLAKYNKHDVKEKTPGFSLHLQM